MRHKLRVLHLTSTYFPDYTGGKEVFVHNLIKSVPQVEHRVLIHDTKRATYRYENVTVEVLPVPSTIDERISYYNLLYSDLGGFEDLLKEYDPDIVHFHDQSKYASLSHLDCVKALGKKSILTYHSPGQSSLQRSLMLGGKSPCDGKMDVSRCTLCRYQDAGIPAGVASLLSRISLPVDKGGKFLKRNSTQLFINSWNRFYQSIDKVQVHAKWVLDMLLMNGVDRDKVQLIEMGGYPSLPKRTTNSSDTRSAIKFVFIGRCTDIKGVHLLVEAIQKLPPAFPVEVYFFGPHWDDTEYGLNLSQRIVSDLRFKKPILLHPEEVIKELALMDVCVIPSLWPETGPLTLFDAFSARIPVIGTDLAGIAERINNGVNGLLFEWNNSDDLSDKIRWLVEEPTRIDFLKYNISDNHTFEEMGEDFFRLYNEICKE